VFDRPGDDDRRLMGYARLAAQRWYHDFIGTEHILLGLLDQGSPVAVSALGRVGVSVDTLRRAVEARMRLGGAPVTMGQLPFTPGAKRVLELSLAEVPRLGRDWVGPEDVLVGIVVQREGVAAKALADVGIGADALRAAVREARQDEGDGDQRAAGGE
jgi:ATP-dependent Clp protease ATP-binding subunit ClpC